MNASGTIILFGDDEGRDKRAGVKLSLMKIKNPNAPGVLRFEDRTSDAE
jgi:hypothetical protein